MTDAIPTPPPAEFDEATFDEAERLSFEADIGGSFGSLIRNPDGSYFDMAANVALAVWKSRGRLARAELKAAKQAGPS